MLPEPFYQDDRVTLYHGDAREIVPQLGRFDLLLTDPPYGIGDRMQGGTWGAKQKYADFRSWDVAPEKAFVDALLSKASSCVIWGGNYFDLPPSRCWFVWRKQNAVPTMAGAELAWTNLDRPVRAVDMPVATHNYGPPTEKPLDLIRWCITEAREAKSILDPYCGSGTTLVAAKREGKRAVGIEIEERYCEVAANRLCQKVLF